MGCRPSSAAITAAPMGLRLAAPLKQRFADAVVNRPGLVALRRKVVATADDAIDGASAHVTAVLTDCRRVHVFVEHAIGSLQRPMTTGQLEARFHGMADAVIGVARCKALIATAGALVRPTSCACRPHALGLDSWPPLAVFTGIHRDPPGSTRIHRHAFGAVSRPPRLALPDGDSRSALP